MGIEGTYLNIIKAIYDKPTHLLSINMTKEARGKDSITGKGQFLQEVVLGASLVVQWLRICMLMQGTRVRALVWEDPTCCGATRPVSHNY